MGVPVLTPRRIGDAADEIMELAPDAAAVVAYGGLIRSPLLHAFPWVNLHFSLLPRWRGAAPVQRAIEAGDAVTGVNVFLLEEGLDTGPVYASAESPITARDTSESLLRSLADLGAPLLVSTMTAIGDGTAHATPQTGEVTLAPRLLPEEGRIDWSGSAAAISRLTRAFWPAPGTWTTLGGARMKIGPSQPADLPDAADHPGAVALVGKRVLVTTGDGALELERVAPPGKQWMDAAAWARGLRESVVFE